MQYKKVNLVSGFDISTLMYFMIKIFSMTKFIL